MDMMALAIVGPEAQWQMATTGTGTGFPAWVRRLRALPSQLCPGRYRWRLCAMWMTAATIDCIDRPVAGMLGPFRQDEIGRIGIG